MLCLSLVYEIVLSTNGAVTLICLPLIWGMSLFTSNATYELRYNAAMSQSLKRRRAKTVLCIVSPSFQVMPSYDH